MGLVFASGLDNGGVMSIAGEAGSAGSNPSSLRTNVADTSVNSKTISGFLDVAKNYCFVVVEQSSTFGDVGLRVSVYCAPIM